MAYGYQYIPRAHRDSGRVRVPVLRPGGGGHVHPLDRGAGAITEAIDAVYRDIDTLRGTVPDLVVAGTEEHSVEAEADA